MSTYFYIDDKGREQLKVGKMLTHAGLTVVSLLALIMGGCPIYNVWERGLAGQAELKQAEQNRQIEVEEAKAKLESAELLNQAEVARARGLAEATALVVDSFGGPDAYLRYLWIQSLESNEADIIYVPTEAGLPILEAGKQADD